jgi:hypothetical protein
MPLWKNDFETMRILLLTHVQRLLERYGDKVDYWIAIAGLSVNNFDLEFDQITELTRSTCQIVKKIAPDAQCMLEITMPWGEYYSRNQRSIPPLLYADLVYQNDMKFDAFAVPLYMGVAVDGFFVRDLLQISEMLEEFLPHGKDVHITLCGVPSSIKKDVNDSWHGKKSIMHAGMWHKPWNEQIQAEWLQALARMALSKPFVKSVCWGDLIDLPGKTLPHGGLLKEDFGPKEAMREMISLRKTLNIIQKELSSRENSE